MLKIRFNNFRLANKMKRTFSQRVQDEGANHDNNNSDSEEDFIHFSKEEVEAKGIKYVNMTKKSLHRMHAHINPFNPLSIPYPINTDYVDWSLHYPHFYGIKSD